MNEGVEIPAENRDAERGFLGRFGSGALNFHLNLDRIERGEGTQEKIGDCEPGARFEANALPDAHSGRAMMPSLFRIVVAEAGRGVDFIPVGIAIRECLPKHGEIIFHPHQ